MVHKELSIQDLVKDVTGCSTNSGYGFGTVNRIPVIEEMSDTMKKPCPNDDCPAKCVEFTHLVDKENGVGRSKNTVYSFDFTDAPRFELDGHYCPICGDGEVFVNSELVWEADGDI